MILMPKHENDAKDIIWDIKVLLFNSFKKST